MFLYVLECPVQAGCFLLVFVEFAIGSIVRGDQPVVAGCIAECAAERFLAEGRRLRIALPPSVDADFNDPLREAA